MNADAIATIKKIDRRYIAERAGKEFVLYAGLLDLAHRTGLKAIRTQLEQAPTEANGWTAIVWAEVTTETGTYTGIGDANPANVGRMVALHTIRMAETRAKARALRDALNVGGCSFEELADDDAVPERVHAYSAPNTTRAAPTARPRPVENVEDCIHASASAEQMSRLGKLQAALGRPVSIVPNLSQDEAAAEIAELVKVFNSAQKAPGRNGSAHHA